MAGPKNRIPDLAYTYKVQDGHKRIGIGWHHQKTTVDMCYRNRVYARADALLFVLHFLHIRYRNI